MLSGTSAASSAAAAFDSLSSTTIKTSGASSSQAEAALSLLEGAVQSTEQVQSASAVTGSLGADIDIHV